MAEIAAGSAADFIARWQGVSASELSTSQSFLLDLCRLLEVDAPHATAEQDYMFERPITFAHGDGSSSAGRIDLYRRGAFVLESKKLKAPSHTRGFDEALLRARSQAENYARALPAAEGRPPFVVVVDVGNRIELYAEFSRSGATYTPFPDPRSHRIALKDLARPEILDRLRRVWTDPLSLDPSRESARVTREIATQLAKLARSLENAGHAPEAVAQFLMRCLFTMFAEDVRLLPAESFRDLLLKYAAQPSIAMRMLAQLWQDMDHGGFSAVLASEVLRFNGKLFKQPDTLPLSAEQLTLLADAARADWRHVEPAIFGTLLERALDAGERHKLGAHYTPRAYVERLVLPTVIEPLREEWALAQAAALTLAAENKHDAAVQELRRFHHRLCTLRVLDPACGSGNFLYVTLEHLKRLEGEVLNALDELGFRQTGLALGGERADAAAGETVDPHNLLGIELNPRAAAIAEVVLWIGYLQWHYRTRGDIQPPQPVIRDFRNIECRDAVLAYDGVEYVTDEHGVPITRWDGVTLKPSPVTGEPIPDDRARIPLERYLNPRKAQWPEADFVVGNPPFIGNKRMRSALGDGYVEALRGAWQDVPESADLVMYWWQHAAQLTRPGGLERFGLITTNSIRQAFNRRVIEAHLTDKKNPISLVFAIPDHPWVDVADGAAVRIAMSVGARSKFAGGQIKRVFNERPLSDGEVSVSLSTGFGLINSDLTIGANVVSSLRLDANRGIACPGIQLSGQGFLVSRDDLPRFSPVTAKKLLKKYVIGSDLTKVRREQWVIDTFGWSEDGLLTSFPDAYQWLRERVLPERLENPRPTYRKYWWRHAETRSRFRAALERLSRIIATCRTARHRTFVFLDSSTLPETKVLIIALGDGVSLGILSSAVHVVFSAASGGHHGVGNDLTYNHSDCFEKFPFPLVNPKHSSRVAALAEALDAHRKRQQAAHPKLTLTGMYNVLEKLRSGEALSAKEREIHEQGLVSVLRQIHDELDAAVLEAYGWSDLLPLLRVAHGNTRAPTAPVGQVSAAHLGTTPDESPGCASGLPGLRDGDEARTEPLAREQAKREFDEAILERLVALNAERAAEEARGIVRWLRPEFQNPQGAGAEPLQAELETDTDTDTDTPSTVVAAVKPKPWPKDAIEQVRAVADALASSPIALSVEQLASRFNGRGPWKKRLPQLLDMLVALGKAQTQNGHYSANR